MVFFWCLPASTVQGRGKVVVYRWLLSLVSYFHILVSKVPRAPSLSSLAVVDPTFPSDCHKKAEYPEYPTKVNLYKQKLHKFTKMLEETRLFNVFQYFPDLIFLMFQSHAIILPAVRDKTCGDRASSRSDSSVERDAKPLFEQTPAWKQTPNDLDILPKVLWLSWTTESESDLSLSQLWIFMQSPNKTCFDVKVCLKLLQHSLGIQCL